jgi:hypothetical protein
MPVVRIGQNGHNGQKKIGPTERMGVNSVGPTRIYGNHGGELHRILV